jgi:hypothetical protein
MSAKKQRKKKQTAVNEVPLTEKLQARLDSFLQAVSNNHPTSALVLVFRPSAIIKGRVDVNVANLGLTDELQNEAATAVRTALRGEVLFYSVSD